MTTKTVLLNGAKLVLANCSLLTLSACGGGGGGSTPPSPPTPTASYTVGGTISGLTGTVVLQNNAGNDLSATNGSFAFTAAIASGSPYSVTVRTPPTSPAQTCTVTNGAGSIANTNVVNIDVNCSVNRYIIGYSVTGLNGTGLVVQNNTADNAAVGSSGSYAFTTTIASGQAYNVSVLQQPSNPTQNCTVANGSGTVANTNISAPVINCVTPVVPTPRFAYVANYYSNNVSGYTIHPSTGALTAIIGSPFASGTNPFSVTVDPSGKFAYVANFNSVNISAYAINPITGELVAVTGSPFSVSSNPSSITVTPSGNFAYVANYASNQVSAYTINPTTGALTEITGSPFAAGAAPYSVSVDPSGKFAYVANGDSGNVSAYTIDPIGGALTAVGGSPFASVSDPYSVTVNPLGKFAYVTNGAADNVSAYAINPVTGALTNVTGSPFAVGTGPRAVAVDPSGKFAYVANANSSNLSAYAINQTTGAWSALPGSPFAAGTGPNSVAVDSLGEFVYVANTESNDISAYSINSATGALTAVAGSPFPAGAGSASIVITGNKAPPPSACTTPTGAGTTHIGVNSAETWTQAGSPHILPFDITINAAVTIEPCAVVRIGAGKTVTIPQIGSIVAAGISGQPIKIEAQTAGQAWASIRNLGGTLSLTHTVVTDGGAPRSTFLQIEGALHMQSTADVGTLHLDNVEIIDSRSQGIYITNSKGFSDTSQNLRIHGSASFPIHVDARVIGSIPTGTYTGNVRDQIAIAGSGGQVTTSQTMHNRGVPYHVGSGQDGGRMDVNSLVNGNVAVLTIEPGVTIQFPPGGTLKIDPASGTSGARGALIANGTAAEPIVFTSDQGAQSAAGDWLGISFGSAVNSQSSMQHVRVEFAGGTSVQDSSSCPYPGRLGFNDAAIRIFGLPQNQFITNTEIISSARDGIDRGWRNDFQPDFLATNTFTAVAGCKQSMPRTTVGLCPVNPSCP